jgi:hypothetical protein
LEIDTIRFQFKIDVADQALLDRKSGQGRFDSFDEVVTVTHGR